MRTVNDINEEIFKSYDIRGTYPKDIDRDVAYTIGRSYGSFIKRNKYTKCILGYDNRHSSLELSTSLMIGILSTGIDVIGLGLVTTPMCLYAKELLNCPCYIMVTASHNPKDENGFKFSVDDTGNAKGDVIQAFKNFTLNGNFSIGQGNLSFYNIKNDYMNLFKKTIDFGNKKLKVVIDLANGTTTAIAKNIYEMFNMDLTIINGESDPDFPNHHPDPCVVSNQRQLQQKILELNADIGIGFDGDGDRVGIVDNKGNVLGADIYMALIVPTIIENSNDKRILYDVKCSKALEDEILKYNGIPIEYRTGASYTMSKIKDDNILFGGEYSGHIYFNDRVPPIGSGLYAGLRIIELLTKTDKKLNELVDNLNKYYSTEEIKIPCKNSIKNDVIDDIKKYCLKMRMNVNEIDGVKINKKDGWGIIRVSGTEAYIKTRFEADSEEKLYIIQKELINLINYYNKK